MATRSPCKLRRSPCKLGGLLKISAFLLQTACHIRPLFGDFMFFISLPRLFLLSAFFTIINNFLAKFKF